MIDKLKSFLTHPMLRDLDIDAPETTVIRSHIIQGKSFLRKIYDYWYTNISGSIPKSIDGQVLELGSGGGFLTDYIPDLITSEILQIPDIDLVLDGQRLPFRKASLRGIVMFDVLHHIPGVDRFFDEASKCIKPGGVIVLHEPWVTTWSRFVYKHLHHEPFDPQTKEWALPDGGPLSQANSALPWILFSRDRKLFERRYPQLQIKEIKLHSPFCYLLSGGVSLRSFLPGFLFGFCRSIEKILNPFIGSTAMFATITIEIKNKTEY